MIVVPVFESSQGRFTSGYTDNLDAYVRNSPVFHARKVRTPLMILHNDTDGAVEVTAGIEYFNALRVPANQKDYLVRRREYFAHRLKGEAAPVWLTECVPQLKIKDHLDERDELTAPNAAKPEPAPGSAN